MHEEAMDPTALAACKKKTTPATAQQWYRMSQCARTFLKRLSGIDPRGRVVAIAMAPHHRTIFGWGGPGKESPAWLADTVFLVEKAASLQDLDRQLGVEVIAGAVKAYKDRSSGLVAPRGGARVQREARTLLLRTFCDRVISMGIIGTASQEDLLKLAADLVDILDKTSCWIGDGPQPLRALPILIAGPLLKPAIVLELTREVMGGCMHPRD